jgi:hypothetical protein
LREDEERTRRQRDKETKRQGGKVKGRSGRINNTTTR